MVGRSRVPRAGPERSVVVGRPGPDDEEDARVTTTDDEIAQEQVQVDVVYGRLDELRAQARARLAAVRREGPTGSPQNRSERDAFATLYEDRVAQLEAVEERLVFGRLDLDDASTRYVGRIGLTDHEQTPLLTDWRAPDRKSVV